jgi:hypothetical protein
MDTNADVIPTDPLSELRRQPNVFRRIIESSLAVGKDIRERYLPITATLLERIRTAGLMDEIGRVDAGLSTFWPDHRGEVVTFIDGGVGNIQIMTRRPVMIRVGVFTIVTGEFDLAKREHFQFYPVLFGELEGGTHSREDFHDVVRMIAEMSAVLEALKECPRGSVTVLHGPLLYPMAGYTGHDPFTDQDLTQFHLGNRDEVDLYLEECQRLVDKDFQWVKNLAAQGRADPVCYLRFLLRRSIEVAREKDILLMGVVERGQAVNFLRQYLLPMVIERHPDILAEFFPARDIRVTSSEEKVRLLIELLNMNDSLLLALLLHEREYTQYYPLIKTTQRQVEARYAPVVDEARGFPRVCGAYLKTRDNMLPIRVELPSEADDHVRQEAILRVFAYSSLLPEYAFPVGLDVVDKFAKIPNWLSRAYQRNVEAYLQEAMVRGGLSDDELRTLVVLQNLGTRDFLFRPSVR